MTKLSKSSEAAPGTYEVDKAMISTQDKRNPQFKLDKAVHPCFVDVYTKKKAFIPGVGNTKIEPSHYNKLSSSPP